jgi:hypothetical protein
MGGCSKNERDKTADDILSLNKTNYTGEQLKIDGYYYQLSEGKIYRIQFFYRNGILSDFSGGNNNFNEAADYIEAVKSKIKNIKYSWGVFVIDGIGIKTEKWHPINAGAPYKAFVRSGEILNDTTFKMTEMYRMQNGQKTEVSAINEIYRFHEYSPKPDSTNCFVQ